MTEDRQHILQHRGTVEPLRLWDAVHGPLNQEMVDWLAIPADSRVLDVGFGAADTTFRMAAAASAGEVHGIERSDELAEIAIAEAARRGVQNVHFQTGDASALDFPDASFGLVWSSRVVHGLPDWLKGVSEFRRVTRPGGRIVLREGGTAPALLPPDIGVGQPGLWARISAAQASWFAGWRAEIPENVRYTSGWLDLLRDAGLENVQARTFLFERTAPFSEDESTQILKMITTLRDRQSIWQRFSEEDRQALSRLMDESDSAYILCRTDLHYIATASVYCGEVPSADS